MTNATRDMQDHGGNGSINAPVPELFATVRTASISPEEVTEAQKTFNEEGLYLAIEDFAREWYGTSGRPARILEFCSSTGLCSWRVSQSVPIESVTLVDCDTKSLDLARERLSGYVLDTIAADAVLVDLGRSFDIILLNSAYHHILNPQKLTFLQNVRRHLAAGGRAIVGDHFLRPYDDTEDFKQAVLDFYGPLLAELKERGGDVGAREIIRQAAHQCWSGVCEFKVSWPVFHSHLVGAGLLLVAERTIWSPLQQGDTDQRIGSIALVLDCGDARSNRSR